MNFSFQASGSLSIATGSKQPQATAIGGGPTAGISGPNINKGATSPASDADADLQARLDNLRRE